MSPLPPDPTPTPPSYVVTQSEVPNATASMVLGILSIILSMPVVGVVMAFIGFSKAKEAKAAIAMNPGAFNNQGIAQAGYVCSIVGLVLGSFTTLCGCGYFIIIALAIGAGAAGAGP